jgi:hypothetical protein
LKRENAAASAPAFQLNPSFLQANASTLGHITVVAENLLQRFKTVSSRGSDVGTREESALLFSNFGAPHA